MCQACYNLGPAARVQFAAPPTNWTCFPVNNNLQLVPPPPLDPPVPAAAAPKPTDKKSHKSKKTKTTKPAVPLLIPRASYVYPLNHTYVHLIRSVKVWDPAAVSRRASSAWTFKIHRVPTSLSVAEFMEAMIPKDDSGGGGAEGWTATEVVELGGGKWSKGLDVKYGDDKAEGTMKSFGWNEKRGERDGLPPVWLVFHKD